MKEKSVESTPNDKELIELEQETAAPWLPGRKRLNQTPVHQIYPYIALDSPCCRPPDGGKSKRTREQLEEDEILQEVLEEEAAIARLTEAAKKPRTSRRTKQANPTHCWLDTRYGRRCQHRSKVQNTLENLGGGFLRNNVEEEDFEEVEGVGNERGQGEEEEEEREEREEEEEEKKRKKKKKRKKRKKERRRICRGERAGKRSIERETTWKGIATEEEEVLEIDKGFVVAEKEVRLDANEVPEGKDRLFNG
ncbi:hypothetical protein H4Q26_017861, partial [Puccinia striiformis f. sp. tritici PST-130]